MADNWLHDLLEDIRAQNAAFADLFNKPDNLAEFRRLRASKAGPEEWLAFARRFAPAITMNEWVYTARWYDIHSDDENKASAEFAEGVIILQ
jgi:hypothetical protein